MVFVLNEKILRRSLALALLVLLSRLAWADGPVIDKVYHPYVDALENEIELRSIFQDKRDNVDNPKKFYNLSFGRSFGDRFFGEFYLIGAESRAGQFDIDVFELELKWQLTEQGQYAADWGFLFELENEFGRDISEFSVGLLGEREFGRWSGTANFLVIQEWGSDIKDEFETALSLQARYRYSRAFEPALEFYAGQDTRGLGPAFLGRLNIGVRKSLGWEAGVIFGMDKKTPDTTYRFLLEYEF
jgi:hypothetical protein